MPRFWTSILVLLALVGAPFFPSAARAADVHVAVAANFAGPMKEVAEQFAKDTGHHAIVSSGATGALFAQIENGAPFEVFLSADAEAPKKLEADGYALAGSRFTYAIGKLVLWSARPGFVDAEGRVLKAGSFQRLAVANPKLAPYGAAAMQALGALGLLPAVQAKIVQGENIAQTFQFVASQNADLGFVALSQVIAPPQSHQAITGSYWVVPENLYAPIQQDAVLLKSGAADGAARALCDYLKTAKVRDLVRAYGYGVTP